MLLVVAGLISLQTGTDGLLFGLMVGGMCGVTIGLLQRQAYAAAGAFPELAGAVAGEAGRRAAGRPGLGVLRSSVGAAGTAGHHVR